MSQMMARTIDKKLIARMAQMMNEMSQRTMAAGVANPNPNPHGWKSWRDIPDSMIPTTSKRDPNNPIYATRPYVDYRKQQIWYQMPNDIPVFLKGGPKDRMVHIGVWVAVSLSLLFNLYYVLLLIFKPSKVPK